MKLKKPLLLIFCLAVFLSSVRAQRVGVTYEFKKFPVVFSCPPDYKIRKQPGKFAFVLSDMRTEFYVIGMKISNLYTADSLEAHMLNLYKDVDGVKNLQARLSGPGSIGGHSGFRTNLSFLGGGEHYVSHAILVRLHINQKYNAVLFYYEIGSGNAISYDPYLVEIATSLQYDTIQYKVVKTGVDSCNFKVPDYWVMEKSITDSMHHYAYTNAEGTISLQVADAKDSTTYKYATDSLEAQMEMKVKKFPDLKVKSGKYKEKRLEGGELKGEYNQVVNKLDRRMLFKKIIFTRMIGGKHKELIFTIVYPEFKESFYEPIMEKFLESLVLGGKVPPEWDD